MDNVVEQTNSEIDLLKEYRTRLTADVVTGKLDVREAARNLPNEPSDPEPSADPIEENLEPDSELEEQEA